MKHREHAWNKDVACPPPNYHSGSVLVALPVCWKRTWFMEIVLGCTPEVGGAIV